MLSAPPELEKRYRRFLEGKGDAIDPLISFLRDNRGRQVDSRAWAALILSRIYLMKGRVDLALSYLRISTSLLPYDETADFPMGVWVNRAIILKARGRAKASESILRRIVACALQHGHVFIAAKAASNLASLLASGTRLDDARSFLELADRCYQALHAKEESVRVELTRAVLESGQGRIEEAIDRITVQLAKCREACLERERITGWLLLGELFLRTGDFYKAEEALAGAQSNESTLRQFRPQNIRFLYLRGEFLRRTGHCSEADRIIESAEHLRSSLELNGLDLRLPDSRERKSISVRFRARCEKRSAISVAGDGVVTMDRYNHQLGDRGECLKYVPSVYTKRDSNLKAEQRSFDNECETFLTRDSRLLALLDEIHRASPLPLPILLRGESGVGKDIIARMIHQWSGREKEPFIPVNVNALPRALFESTLFGHERGAFTGAVMRRPGILESAGSGTVFLDEIGDLDLSMQAKLLRLIDRGEFLPLGESRVRYIKARIVAATNRNLKSLCSEGRFRRDLYYRLTVLAFHIHPLRERRADIPLLADHFLSYVCRYYKLGNLRMTDGAMTLLTGYDWPGNVRELQGEIIKAALKARRGVLRTCHFSVSLRGICDDGREGGTVSLVARIHNYERAEIIKALHDAGGNCTKAAEFLGVKRTTLIHRMKRLGIDQ